MRFAAVGIATAALYYGLLVTSVEYFALAPTLASSICYVVAVVFNYLLHYSWTYAASTSHVRAGGRYLAMILTGFMVNGMVMHVGVNGLGIHYLLVQTCAVVVIAGMNFLMASLWVFRE